MNNNIIKTTQIPKSSSQNQAKFETLVSTIRDIICPICTGFGHFPDVCGTKNRIDEMVKFVPGAREHWRSNKWENSKKVRVKKEYWTHARLKKVNKKLNKYNKTIYIK